MHENIIVASCVENEPGALSRVVGLFSARGYNIEIADGRADRGRRRCRA